MESPFKLIAIFLILDISFVCTAGNTNLEINVREGFLNLPETYAPRSVKRREIAQVSNRRSPVSVYRTADIPDFVFPGFKPLTQIQAGINVSSEHQETDRRVDIPNRSATSAKQVIPESVAASVPKIKIRRALTPEERVSIHIQQLKMKSKQKCHEYAKEIEKNAGISCVDIVPVLSKVDEYVINGTETEINEFPHMVALGKYNFDRKFALICGGALISHTWVLSAAHCTHGANGKPSYARIGFHKLMDQQSGITIAINNTIRHPDYKIPFMYADIALMKLVSAVTFTASIRPVCLYQQYYTAPKSAWISGWGVTELNGIKNSDILLKAQLDLIDNLECRDAYNNVREVPNGITSRMLCAGDSRGNWSRDTCQGDSGGPLQTQDPIYSCLFQVVGITSFGLGCALVPGVYTKVSSYTQWIENIVWP